MSSRRVAGALLLPVFAALLLSTLLTLRVNRTLLRAGFYAEVLERASAYDAFYEEALPSLLERAGLEVRGAPSSLGLSAEGLSSKLRRVIPPEALRLQVTSAAAEVIPYLAGQEDGFELAFDPGDWIDPGADVVRELVRDPELVRYLLSISARPAIEAQWDDLERSLPFPLGLTADDVLEGLSTACSGPWLAEQVDAALDGLVPYVRGRTDELSVRLELAKGAKGALEVLRGWVHRALEGEGHEHWIRQHAVPPLRLLMGSGVPLPYEVSLTDDELAAVLGLALPRTWAKAELDRAIDAVGGYLTGERETGAFAIVLRDRVEKAALLLAAAVNVKARAAYDGLPECRGSEAESLGAVPGTLPSCRVPGLEYAEVRASAGYDTAEVLRGALARLPESIDVTDEDLRAAFSDLEAVRESLTEGIRLGVPELRLLVEAASPPAERADAWERFQRVRLQLRDGVRLTDGDLRSRLDPRGLAAIDRTRRWLGFARLLPWTLAAATALAGFGIVRLGGSTKSWGGSALVLGGALTAGAALLVQTLASLVGSHSSGTLLEIRDAAVSELTGPLLIQGLLVALAGIALVLWGRTRRPQSTLPVSST